jgi:hypothetical protein
MLTSEATILLSAERPEFILIGVMCDEQNENIIGFSSNIFSPMAQEPLVGQGLLIIEVSRPHSETPHSLGLL